MLESAFDTLRVGRDASSEAIRKAYVTLVRRYPPEHFPEKFASVRRAYQSLTLEDEIIEEAFQRTNRNHSPLELAGYLWGDRRELMPEGDLDLSGLAPLLSGEGVRRELEALLSAAAENIEWKME